MAGTWQVNIYKINQDVLATLDDVLEQRDIQTIEDFKKIKSNVAKFSLKELIEKMMGKGFAFKITQITKV